MCQELSLMILWKLMSNLQLYRFPHFKDNRVSFHRTIETLTGNLFDSFLLRNSGHENRGDYFTHNSMQMISKTCSVSLQRNLSFLFQPKLYVSSKFSWFLWKWLSLTKFDREGQIPYGEQTEVSSQSYKSLVPASGSES